MPKNMTHSGKDRDLVNRYIRTILIENLNVPTARLELIASLLAPAQPAPACALDSHLACNRKVFIAFQPLLSSPGRETFKRPPITAAFKDSFS